MMTISPDFETLLSLSVYHLAIEGGIDFDSAETDAHDEDGDDQATERSVGVLGSRGSSDTSEKYVASSGREISMSYGEMNNPHAQVNQREGQGGVITPQQTVSGDGTDEERGVDPETIESPDGKDFCWPIPRAPATLPARWTSETALVVEPGDNLVWV